MPSKLIGDPRYDPVKLLDTLIHKLSVKNDAELARRLRVAPPLLSKVRHRAMPVSAALLLRMHEVSDISIRELRDWMGDHRVTFSDSRKYPKQFGGRTGATDSSANPLLTKFERDLFQALCAVGKDDDGVVTSSAHMTKMMGASNSEVMQKRLNNALKSLRQSGLIDCGIGDYLAWPAKIILHRPDAAVRDAIRDRGAPVDEAVDVPVDAPSGP